MANVVGHNELIPEGLNLAERRGYGLEDRSLERGVVTDELIDCRAKENCILLVQQHFDMALRGEDGEYGWDDAWACCQLGLSRFVEAESPDGVGNGLQSLRNKDQLLLSRLSLEIANVPRLPARHRTRQPCKTPPGGQFPE